MFYSIAFEWNHVLITVSFAVVGDGLSKLGVGDNNKTRLHFRIYQLPEP